MNSLVTSRNQDNSLASSVIEYSSHVKDLELRVKELAAELASFRSDVQPRPANGPEETNDIADTQPLDDTGISYGSAILGRPLSGKDS
jgi:hypothetical protein